MVPLLGERCAIDHLAEAAGKRTLAPRIYEVAQRAGVSIATVSRVLNGRHGVAGATRDRVREAVRALGYQPHEPARGLASRASRTLGLIIGDIRDPYFGDIVRGAQEAGEEAGYLVVLVDAALDREREGRLVQQLIGHRVEGLVIASARGGRHCSDALSTGGIPLVGINDHRPGAVHTVQIDNHKGAGLAAHHLLELGHQRIGHLAGPPGVVATDERLAGYRRALEDAGVAVDPALVVTAGGDLDRGRREAARLLAMPDPPTAIFAYNDRSAIGTCLALRDRGLRAGRDVSVVGFDDLPMASWVDPPLTTVAQPRQDMGRLAVERLLLLLEGAAPAAPIVVDPYLVVRGSANQLLPLPRGSG